VIGITWTRRTEHGAWVRLGESVLVELDEERARSLGVEGAPRDGPLEASLAVTTRCRMPCEGCYLDARSDGHDVAFAELAPRLEALAQGGASLVAFGGGEPLLHPELGRLAEHARALGLVPVTTTSGVGLTEERLRGLGALAQINVSHDGAGDAYRRVRGYDASAAAERAISLLVSAEHRVGLNLVLTRETMGELERTARLACELGACELQLLRFKPSGRGERGYEGRALGPDDVASLFGRVRALVAELGPKGVSVRIDCSMVPLLSQGLLAAGIDGAALERAGVFGCEAGRHLGAVRADGSHAPCSFFTSLSTSDGELVEPRALVRGAGTSSLSTRLRRYHAALAEPCDRCELASACRGGCQVVSVHAHGRFGPDPECPRVLEREGREPRSTS
jgi:radical SAM protein with 4Fe4S-binding SPASM domain